VIVDRLGSTVCLDDRRCPGEEGGALVVPFTDLQNEPADLGEPRAQRADHVVGATF
jgi:hypothetical protein